MYLITLLIYAIYFVFSSICFVDANIVSRFAPVVYKSPSKVQVCSRNETSITICWQSPAFEQEVNITSYYVLFENVIVSVPRPVINTFPVSQFSTFATISSLISGDAYDISVIVEYQGKRNVSSAIQTVRTMKPSECHCFFRGTANVTENCTSDFNCSCLVGYTGAHCEVCEDKYYITLEEKCLPCPCTNTSTEYCFANKGRVECENCLEGYAKPLCQKCETNYFRSNGVCLPCNCNGNGQLFKNSLCDPQSGQCFKCVNNTAGKKCEYCASGYHGDAKKAKNCSKIDIKPHLPPHEGKKQHIGTIVGACITVLFIMILGGIFICYKYCRYSSSPISFWNMQLKEETVNLKSMQDYHILEDNMEEIPVRTELKTIKTISKDVEEEIVEDSD